MMKLKYDDNPIPLIVGVGFLSLLTIVELISILILNNGFLVYTLDDPYIHMALSENILTGHYGINKSEFSAPSSSIIWPIILAPFSSIEEFPLILNFFSAVITVYIFSKVLNVSINLDDKRKKSILITILLIIFILTTNVVGLIFTGMEHSLQVLLASIIAYGMIAEIENKKIENLLLFAIISAPLIRYENLAISFAAIGFFVLRGHYKNAALAVILLSLLVGVFSFFLNSLGLGPLPTSVIAKSAVVESGGKFIAVIINLLQAIFNRQGVILMIGVVGLLLLSLVKLENPKRQLALSAVFAISLHFIAGRYGWYNRYEIYIWTFFVLIFTYLFLSEQRSVIRLATMFICFMVIAGKNYVIDLYTLPIAANNIYEQQYQMHRFVVDYYKGPVAVNDLGYVSYKNDGYVLDLWGLGYRNALNFRKNLRSSEWMTELVDKNDIKLIMIYDDWFQNKPKSWIKIGELYLGKKRITPARSKVDFYAINLDAYYILMNKLQSFIQTLPPNVRFHYKVIYGINKRKIR